MKPCIVLGTKYVVGRISCFDVHGRILRYQFNKLLKYENTQLTFRRRKFVSQTNRMPTFTRCSCMLLFKVIPLSFSGPGSSVGIATAYGLDGPGIESRWGRDFPQLSRPALRPTQPPVQWVPGLSRGVRCCRGVTLTLHPLLVPRSKIE